MVRGTECGFARSKAGFGSFRSRFLLAALFVVSAACRPGGPQSERLSVLLITLDTTRADCVAPTGGEVRVTPHLQALGERSAVFTHAVSETNITNPSHLSIMSGLRAIEHGVIDNQTLVPPEVDTLAEAMKRAGYRTAGVPAVRHVGSDMGWRAFDLLLGVEEEVDAREVTDRTLAWLQRIDDSAFFLWVHYFDPHTDYEPPPQIAARFVRREAGKPKHDPGWYDRALYAAEIHFVDRHIGRLLAELERSHRTDDTVVVVVADHGESLGEHEIVNRHIGLYEPQLRIPLIFHVPGLPPSRSDAWARTLDVAPTIGELTDVRFRHQPSGRSLVPLLRGGTDTIFSTTPVLIYQHAHNHAAAVRQGPWKLIWPISLEHPVHSDGPELYHLGDDPGELTNLAAAKPEQVQDLRRLLQPWIDLGQVEHGDTVHLPAAALEQLRALGYLDD
jgi:arylsulfatase A-like enzyme